MDSHFLGRYFAQKQHPGMEEGYAPTDVQENGVNGHVNGNSVNGHVNGNGVKDHLSGDTHTKTYHNGNADYRNPADKTDKRVLAAAPQIPTFDDRGPFLSGFQRPTKFEGQIEYLEVYGEIPKSLSGTFYRIMPDPMFPSSVYNDQWINGDGNVSAFRIKDGRVHFKQRYVKTEKLQRERDAGRALMGKYRNPYTDLVDFRYRTVANTNIVWFRGLLLACKEDGKPYAMDPETLETKGVWDFGGQYKSDTMTAHPKYDVGTRELLTFGYEAKGLATRSICYAAIDNETGKFNQEVWLEPPVCGMQHDFAITDNYVVFPINCHTADLEDMKQGKEHWHWNPDIPLYIGVLPRRGAKSEDVKWFEGPNGFVGHVANAYEEDGKVVIQLSHATGNMFTFWPAKDGKMIPMGTHASRLVQWDIDFNAIDIHLGQPKVLIENDNEFLRVDDRMAGKHHTQVFGLYWDTSKDCTTEYETIFKRVGGGFPFFNKVYRYNTITRKTDYYFGGPFKLFQEPCFIPRSPDSPEGDGYIIVLVNNYEDMSSELVIIDTKDFENYVALIKLPIRLRMGIHGNWVDDADVDGHPGPIIAATD